MLEQLQIFQTVVSIVCTLITTVIAVLTYIDKD